MSRGLFLLLPGLLLFCSGLLLAHDNDAPPVVITSPDAGTTFAYASIKDHTLVWNSRSKMLLARVTFTDSELNNGTPNDDTHLFRLPGVTFDEAKGLFYAISAKGEMIPVARVKKSLFMKTIETTPNAIVRVQYPNGDLTVILEAIRPDDPAMRAAKDPSPDDAHKVDMGQILQ